MLKCAYVAAHPSGRICLRELRRQGRPHENQASFPATQPSPQKEIEMSSRPAAGSGDGTRPATSGGVDNMGGGESFSGKKTAAGADVSGPAPKERMQDKRKDVEATRHDDSAAFGLTEDLTPASNREPSEGAPAPKSESDSREEAIRRAAYDAYQRRGGEAGHETQDWLDAEAEVDRQAGRERG
jgi:hypothetical protein